MLEFKSYKNIQQTVIKDEIQCVKAIRKYTYIYVGQSRLFCSFSFKKINEYISKHPFIKVSRSATVNKNYITELKAGKNPFVILENGEKIKVSEARIKEVELSFLYLK